MRPAPKSEVVVKLRHVRFVMLDVVVKRLMMGMMHKFDSHTYADLNQAVTRAWAQTLQSMNADPILQRRVHRHRL